MLKKIANLILQYVKSIESVLKIINENNRQQTTYLKRISEQNAQIISLLKK